jgi:diguanylate cyclase
MADRSRARRLLLLADRWLGRLLWGVVAVGAVLGMVSTGFSPGETPSALTLLVVAVFFPVLCVRLAVAVAVDPERRVPRIALLTATALWAGGSMVLHQDGAVSSHRFPGPAEFFFLPAYVGFAWFLLVDSRRTRRGRKVWLETVLLCGALATLAGTLLVSPLGDRFPVQGPTLLLVLVYPLLDFALLLLVVGQVLVGARGRGRDTALLVTAIGALVALDLWYFLMTAGGQYYANVVTDIAYGATFALLATAASMPRSTPPTSRHDQGRGRLLVLAGATALALLALRPAGSEGLLVTVPAVVTLVAAGARLTVALREAQGAAEARELSRTDELTGLLNRRALLDDLGDAILGGRPLALVLMDLDGFKDVNDSLGHTVGDQLLQEVGQRVVLALPESSAVARIGGDEFALLVREDDELRLLELARRVRHAVSQRLQVDGVDVVIGASLGLTRRPEPGIGAVEMLRRADVAMYQAKHGRLGTAFYEAAHDGFSRGRLQQVEQLREGIAAGQLRLWYQPLVDAATQAVTAVEALVRWEHPVLGMLQPVAFLPEARRAGLMGPLTDAVVDMVVADAQRWAREGKTFTVAFNCAPPELLGVRLVPHLLDAVRRSGLPADRLVVEVTEDSFVNDPDRAREVLRTLRAHRLQVAIDDYGTGFSSLAYLRDLPVQTLKLDRSFVRALDEEGGRVIVESTLQMAHALGLRLVAEGVEDAAAAATLVAMGVDVLQGYHVSRPMPADEVARWVDAWETQLRASAGW